MSLTPRKDDPNRKDELSRKKKQPDTFGHPMKKIPNDWAPSGLKQTAEARNKADAELEKKVQQEQAIADAKARVDETEAALAEAVANELDKKVIDKYVDEHNEALTAYNELV